jgi:hypothetical protein
MTAGESSNEVARLSLDTVNEGRTGATGVAVGAHPYQWVEAGVVGHA